MMGWYGYDGMGTGGWIAMIAMMTAFWGLVILAGVMIFRGNGNGGRSGRGVDDAWSGASTRYRDPADILDERFALGELDDTEYQARKAVLHAGRH